MGDDRESHGKIRLLELGMAWFPEQPGGLDRYFYELLRALADFPVSFQGLVTGSEAVGCPSNGLINAFAETSSRLPVRWGAVRRKVAAYLREWRHQPTVIAAHFALYAAPIISLLGRRPFIIHFHGPWAAESKREGGGRIAVAAKWALEKYVYSRADLCIVLSEAFKHILVDTYGVNFQKIRIVPGGVDIGRFKPADAIRAREAVGWPVDRPVVLCVRRLARRMGLENLVHAVEIVRKAVPDVLVMIGGSGGLKNQLQAQIDSLGLSESVKLVGFIPDDRLPLAYKAATLSIVPTESLEGFGLTTVESLACGTPVLVTPVGGLPEVVRDLSANLILRDASVASIAAGLTDALTGRLPLPSRDACAAFARARYDWNAVARRVLDVYEEALACRR